MLYDHCGYILFQLESNALKIIPKEINCLQKLKDLNVKKNKIKHLCDELFTLTSLKKLMVAYNELESISPKLSNLTMLQELVRKLYILLYFDSNDMYIWEENYNGK